jgi:hypothetical protein
MSYIVDILSGETPKSYEEALVVRDRMTKARESGAAGVEPPSAVMRALHDRVTARYPCITKDPDHGPWSDGPLINNFGQQTATLGLSFSRVDEVLPFLVTTATGMGFWVLDTQEACAHLPGGVTIQPGGPTRPRSSGKGWWQFWK